MAMQPSIGSDWRWRQLTVPFILLMFAATPGGASLGPIDDLALSGRVVEIDTRKPIAGAEVSLGANDPRGEPRKPEQVVTSDADGRFTLRLRSDREGERRSAVVVRVRHREYIARQSQPHSVTALRDDAARGVKPFFDMIELERGEEYRSRVVTPDGEPAEGVVFNFGSDRQSNISSPFFYDDVRVTSDSQGRVRVRLVKPSVINVYTHSAQFAALNHQFNGNDRQRYPGGTLPNDLGTFLLSRGQVISGRLVDLDGKPIAGVGVQVQLPQNGAFREGRTDASGTFQLPGLAPGGYFVTATGRIAIDDPRPKFAYPIKPEFVQLGSGGAGATVELKEVRSVAVRARFVDAKGRPARGCPVMIYGQIVPPPPPPPVAVAVAVGRVPEPVPDEVVFALAEAVNGAGVNRLLGAIFGNPAQQARRNVAFQWYVEAEPDAEGRVVVRVPKGLSNASIQAHDESGSMVYTIRPKADAQQIVGYAALGVLNEDPAPIEFVASRSARLTVRIVLEDGGKAPEELNIQAYIHTKGRNWGGIGGQHGEDGVTRMTGMVPDQPYLVHVNANGYLPISVEGVTLPEGGSRDLTLTLARTPEAVKVGDLAPPILVTTLDGKGRSLADYQGRFLLVTVWSTRQTPDAMTKIKAIRERFGADERLAMLGLNYEFDRETIEAHLKERKIDWPQARLGAEFSRIVALFGCKHYPNSFLIGPDGAIVALNLTEAEIEEAVAKALKK